MRPQHLWASSLWALSALVERSTAASTTSVFAPPTPSVAPTVNGSEYDLSKHYCRLWRHASVYADGKIYIDGGNTYRPKGNTTFNNTPANSSGWASGMNTQFLVLDVSKNFTNQDTFPYTSLLKGPDVPNTLIENALWYSSATRKIYQLGGWFSFNNNNNAGYYQDSQIPSSAIWQFDIDTQTWSKATTDFDLVNTGSKIDRPGAAAYCDAPTLNRSFIFEGYVQHRSDPDYVNYTQSADFKFLEGMLSLDTTPSLPRPVLSNISVPTYIGPRMNGAMVHVPIGKQGVLVQIAGQTTRVPTPYGVRIPKANEGNVNINNSFVDIYDIESGYWFRQQTFGMPSFPSDRSDICTVVVPAADKSSFNIYMVAGTENYATGVANEEIWVLSLPTFQWFLAHTRSDALSGHSCHVLGENLLIIGGLTSIATLSSSSATATGACAAHMPAEIFSLATLSYTGQFDAAAATRVPPVPPKVVEAVGGTSAGGAVIRQPRVWDDLYLQYVFDPSLVRPAYTPPQAYTLANETDGMAATGGNDTAGAAAGSKNNAAVIGGSVAGAVVAVGLVAVGVVLCLRWRRKHTASHMPMAVHYEDAGGTTTVVGSGEGQYYRGSVMSSELAADESNAGKGFYKQGVHPQPLEYGAARPGHGSQEMAVTFPVNHREIPNREPVELDGGTVAWVAAQQQRQQQHPQSSRASGAGSPRMDSPTMSPDMPAGPTPRGFTPLPQDSPEMGATRSGGVSPGLESSPLGSPGLVSPVPASGFPRAIPRKSLPAGSPALMQVPSMVELRPGESSGSQQR